MAATLLPPPPPPETAPPPPPGYAPAVNAPMAYAFAAPPAYGLPAAAPARRPATEAERGILLAQLRHTRTPVVVMSAVAMAFAVAYIAVPGFVTFILATAIVLATGRVAFDVRSLRKGAASPTVVEYAGVPAKLGEERNRKGLYGLQFGADRLLVPLAVYDAFGPATAGRLTLLEGADLVLAVNGVPRPRPEKAFRPRGA